MGPYERSFGEWVPKDDPNHPEPGEDLLLKDFYIENIYFSELKSYEKRKKFVFGFTSKDQFHSWFYKKEWKEYLHRHGFVLNKYLPYGKEGEDYKLGETQAIFIMDPKGPVSTSLLI